MEQEKTYLSNEKFRNVFIAGCVTIAFFTVLFLCYRPMLALNDDMMIESILSGSFLRPYAKSFYLSSELGFLLSGFYRILPRIPWLGVFYIFSEMLSLFLILYLALSRARTITGKIMTGILSVSMFATFCMASCVIMHYTVLSAMLGAVGLAYFISVQRKEEFLLPIVLFLLCYLIRENVFFLLFPFIGIALIWILVKNGWNQWKEYIPWAFLFFIVTGLAILCNRGSLNGEEWSYYKEYNAIRTDIYDFLGVNTSPEAMESYGAQGISEEEIYVVSSYDFGLMADDARNLQILKAVQQYGEKNRESTADRLIHATKGYIYRFFHEKREVPRNILIIFLYLSLIIIFLIQKNYGGILVLILLSMYRSAAWIFLIFRGRYPDRVLLPLYLMELAILVPMFVKGMEYRRQNEDQKLNEDRRQNKDQNRNDHQKLKALFAVYFVAILITLAGVIPEAEDMIQRIAHADEVNRNDDLLVDYMHTHPDTIYLLDVYAIVERTKPALQTGIYENYLLLGGWMYEHPLYKEKVRKYFGTESNSAKAFTECENVRLVLKDGAGLSEELIRQWLGLSLKQVDIVQGESEIYRIYQYNCEE